VPVDIIDRYLDRYCGALIGLTEEPENALQIVRAEQLGTIETPEQENYVMNTVPV